MTVGIVSCETVGGDATEVGWEFEIDVSAWYTRKNITCLNRLDIMLEHGCAGQREQA